MVLMTATLVLVVDDDAAVLKLIELTLVAAGFNVLAFESSRDAAAELEEGLRPDVIVSDISMPGLDGFEFYKRVRTIPELHAIPFLFLTAMEDRSYVRQGMTLGADDYLTKPFERQELVDAVRIRLQRIEELRHPLEGTVRARALGHPFIERNGKRLDWDSLKALELLFYMLEHRSGVTTYEVAEALWPGKSEAKASSSFHTTLYRLRKVMGGELVESANRRYYLRKEFRIDYDVERYRAAAQKARDSASADAFEQAVRHYGGHFLVGFDSAWVEDARQMLHADHLSLLQGAAERAQERGDLEAATRYYQSMTEHEPFSETAWSGLAEVWESRGEPGKAEVARSRFAALMNEG
jgi:two-component SAPR family response regulator